MSLLRSEGCLSLFQLLFISMAFSLGRYVLALWEYFTFENRQTRLLIIGYAV